jgi:hypothetical protein
MALHSGAAAAAASAVAAGLSREVAPGGLAGEAVELGAGAGGLWDSFPEGVQPIRSADSAAQAASFSLSMNGQRPERAAVPLRAAQLASKAARMQAGTRLPRQRLSRSAQAQQMRRLDPAGARYAGVDVPGALT